MKRILITGGPTNEYIDEVMKITNMSSGKLAVELAQYFAEDGDNVTLCITKTVRHPQLAALSAMENVNIIQFETTHDLQTVLEICAASSQYDIVIHSAAVADYKPEFSFRMEDMASEITDFIMNNQECLMSQEVYEKVLGILTNPQCKINDDTKISSVEPHLTVKMGLTPKIIASLGRMFPSAFICGFKLLESVPEEELINAAIQQINKCDTDMCFANDLAELRKSNATRLVVTKNGYHNIKVDGAYGIFNLLKIVTSAD